MNVGQPGVYFRYVDDTFIFFGSELSCDDIQEKFNLLRPALMFTVDGEAPLLEFVEKADTGFLIHIYR